MGRPKKEERRERQLNIGLTKAEFDTVQRRAFATGTPLVDYSRAVLLSRRTAIAANTPLTCRYDQLAVLQLQRLGNLLNQLVRRVHQNGDLPIEELVGLLRDIRAELGRALS
jgi:hypothetical protein